MDVDSLIASANVLNDDIYSVVEGRVLAYWDVKLIFIKNRGSGYALKKIEHN